MITEILSFAQLNKVFESKVYKMMKQRQEAYPDSSSRKIIAGTFRRKDNLMLGQSAAMNCPAAKCPGDEFSGRKSAAMNCPKLYT